MHDDLGQKLSVINISLENLADKMAVNLDETFDSLESVLAKHLPADVLEKVNLSLRGPGSMYVIGNISK